MDKEYLKPLEDAERAESSASEYEDDILKDLYPARKVEQWDCDSIISI